MTHDEMQATGTGRLSGGEAGGSLSPPPAGRARLDDARDGITEPGEYLAHEQDGEVRLVRLEAEWTRVGRSLAADVRFDDPAVSRRHALLVRAPDGVRIIDDRSLNGVWVNGDRVEWRSLADGDEIRVGTHVLRFLVATAVGAERTDTVGA